MHPFHQKTIPNQTLSVKALCDEVETHYHFQIRQSSGAIVAYLQKNGQIENLLPSASELVHIIFYKLRYEIRKCLLKEKRTLFPLLIAATAKDTTQITDAIEPIRKIHQHILELTQKLRQIINQYELHPHYSKSFKDFVGELRNLENNISKWVLVEEDLIFPKVFSDLAKAKFITSVFR